MFRINKPGDITAFDFVDERCIHYIDNDNASVNLNGLLFSVKSFLTREKDKGYQRDSKKIYSFYFTCIKIEFIVFLIFHLSLPSDVPLVMVVGHRNQGSRCPRRN